MQSANSAHQKTASRFYPSRKCSRVVRSPMLSMRCYSKNNHNPMPSTISNWYRTFCDQFDNIAETLDLTDDQTNRIRDFIMCIARDQFKAGNRCGVSWAFTEARKKIAQGQEL